MTKTAGHLSPSVVYQAACHIYAENKRTGENCLQSQAHYAIPGTQGRTYRQRDMERACFEALEIAKIFSEALDTAE